MTTPQELRQALAQAKEALTAVQAVIITAEDKWDESWPAKVGAALSALSAVLDSDSSHLAACDSAARSGSGVPARPTVEPCPRGDDKPEVTCTNRHQCWEPCGELGNSAEHVRVVRACPVDFAEKQTGYKRCPKHPRYVTTPFCPDCLREAEAALAASPLPQEGRWQPIESAPKDGTRVLFFRRDWREGFAVGYWDATWFEFRPVGGECFPGPTHWMPLPAAPGTQGEQKCSG